MTYDHCNRHLFPTFEGGISFLDTLRMPWDVLEELLVLGRPPTSSPRWQALKGELTSRSSLGILRHARSMPPCLVARFAFTASEHLVDLQKKIPSLTWPTCPFCLAYNWKLEKQRSVQYTVCLLTPQHSNIGDIAHCCISLLLASALMLTSIFSTFFSIISYAWCVARISAWIFPLVHWSIGFLSGLQVCTISAAYILSE